MRTRASWLALGAAMALGAGALAACERRAEPDENPAVVESTEPAVDESQVKDAAKDAAREVAAGATAVAEGVKEGVAEGRSEAKKELREDEAASLAAPKS